MRSRLDNTILISWLSYDNEFCSVSFCQSLWFEQFDINLYVKISNIVIHDRLQTFLAIDSSLRFKESHLLNRFWLF